MKSDPLDLLHLCATRSATPDELRERVSRARIGPVPLANAMAGLARIRRQFAQPDIIRAAQRMERTR